ncbi:amino acid racemase [Paludicola sp. MB14-C6]|uniref:aspartate/glutamate racemase family protein n=1 Tax=Paludihabitans sp. MB14-C6 TaxID=3070656 RepID=UPI0027DD06DD|nr:amino acid racemase [Paludicola sp. MB14-C6]WMJ22221.1 amino acid racemase [Paludicola sp. MB14-C6]
MKRKTLGVIGGVGPLSTAYFMEVLINKTDAQIDQEHIDMIVLNHTEIPDRTAFILGRSEENPAFMMKEDAKKLEAMGADIIVTPCNTAHYFYQELQDAVTVPFINMIDETAIFLKEQGVGCVGILATNGTIQTKLFQNALQNQQIEAICPSQQNQQYVMDIIYDNVKANQPVDLQKFKAVVNELRLQGCERVILGCTELSILKREYSLNNFYVDSLEVLVEKAITACGKKVKK